LLPGGMRRRKIPQVELKETGKKEKYDVAAALTKALLVFMISYGAVGGFLNAYGIAFNRFFCIGGLMGLALILAFIYETGKKWFTNLCVIGIFVAYAYVAVRRFWILNSGAYAVINEIYEAAQSYLGVVGGGLYNLQVEDTYQTVTAIALFVGVVFEILMVIRLQYKASLLRTVLFTFTLYFVPIYFEKTPDLLCLFLLLSGYATLGILQNARIKKNVSKQIKNALPIGMVLAGATVVLLGILLPKVRYWAVVPKNPVKAETEGTAMTFAQYGVMALFMNNAAGGGLNEGRLSQNTMMVPTDETHLIVRFTPYSMETTYLKAFTGLDYDGQRWSKATDVLGRSEDKMLATTAARKAEYEADPQIQPRGVMEVYNVGAAQGYEYRPYYTDGGEVMALPASGFPGGAKNGMTYTYYPVVRNDEVPGAGEEQINERYLWVPPICKRSVANACEEAALAGTPEEIAAKLAAFFEEKYAYTLRPGYYFGGLDYVSYFLSRNKKGYCTHFASAGTLMLRYMGIPARYVEGYVFSYTDVVTDGELMEDREYKDYYDGYAPLGETAMMEVEIPDGQAHAWIEAYVEGKGWIVVDVTPSVSQDEEETASFWDAILGGGDQNAQDGDGQQAAAEYVENVLAGGMGVLGLLIAAVLAIFIGKHVMASYRESKLPGKERVQLEYGRMTAWVKDRDEEFRKLTTPGEELGYLATRYGVTIPENLQGELYGTFFAPETGRNYEQLRKQVTGLWKSVRKAHRRA